MDTSMEVAASGPAEDVRVLTTADGRADVQVRTASGAWVRVHDVDRPHAEARELVDRALQGQLVPPAVAVIGIGLGYVVEELERRRPDVCIVAVELVPGLLDLLRRRPGWHAECPGRRIVAVDPTYELPVPSWPTSAAVDKPIAVVNPVLGRHFPEAYERARKALKQFFYEQRANADARRRLAGLYLRHTIENLPALAGATDVAALDGIAAGAPVVLCGAGPSLDRLLPALRTHRHRAWFIALDTALTPLVRAGIVPDMVVSVDPTPLNGRHLINLPARARPWLVAEASLDARVLAAFEGRIFACRIGRADPWPWLETLGLAPTRLRVWGSVLTAACDLVSRMRAAHVVFAGMDLAFTGGQPYCRGTAFELDWILQQQRDALPSIEEVWAVRIASVAIEEADLDGRSVRTAPQMVAFRNWVRGVVAASPERTFTNITGAGILHGPGIAQAELSDVLERSPLRMPPERALRGTARRSFADTVPRLASAIDTLAGAGDPSGLWRAWAAAIPQFNEAQTRRLLEQTVRRLRAADGASAMTAPATDWIDVPYDPSNFMAKAPLEWKVAEPCIATYAYRVQGKTMTLAFKINHSRLEGLPANEIYVRIPGNYLPARGTANPIWISSPAGKECGYATVHPGLDVVVLFRATEERFPVEHGSLFAFGQLTFEVQ